MGKNERGNLLVIVGIGGSGKTTQAELLQKRLQLSGVSSVIINFPRYNEKPFGQLIKDYLGGKLVVPSQSIQSWHQLFMPVTSW